MRLFSPAKINLFLAVTGRRADGFHELVSLVSPVSFGDWLEVDGKGGSCDSLDCDRGEIPTDSTNLILKAAAAFRERTGIGETFRFRLEKRIPAGGGFGGGSGNAARALEGMNLLAGEPLGKSELREVAAEVGSDCPLFLEKGAAVIRGRGERVEAAPDWTERLRDWKLALFNPGISVSTRELYGEIAAEGNYTSPKKAEAALAEAGRAFAVGDPGRLLCNDLGTWLAKKNLFYDTWSSLLKQDGFPYFGITGSGSGCFLLLREGEERLRALVERWIGRDGFLIETVFGGPDDE